MPADVENTVAAAEVSAVVEEAYDDIWRRSKEIWHFNIYCKFIYI